MVLPKREEPACIADLAATLPDTFQQGFLFGIMISP
jgi:hypothetical protein